MTITTMTAPGEYRVRRAADRIDTPAARGRLRARRRVEHPAASDDVVLQAVARARLGDDDAIRFLYLRYAGNVYGYVRSIVHDEHETEDVTQLVFLKLLTSLPKYEPRAVPFSAWILRVAHNAAVDQVRSRRAIPFAEVRSAEAEAEDHEGSRERGRDLLEALAMLPADQREVVVLRFILGFTPGEVARRLGRSEDSIHGLQHRGRRALRVELSRRHAAPAAWRTTADATS